MVRTRAMRTWLGLGLHALGVAIFALSVTTPVAIAMPCTFETPSAAPIVDRLPNCRIMPPLVIAGSRG
jgi:hypothetical protein